MLYLGMEAGGEARGWDSGVLGPAVSVLLLVVEEEISSSVVQVKRLIIRVWYRILHLSVSIPSINKRGNTSRE